jgi:hypothetical protein
VGGRAGADTPSPVVEAFEAHAGHLSVTCEKPECENVKRIACGQKSDAALFDVYEFCQVHGSGTLFAKVIRAEAGVVALLRQELVERGEVSVERCGTEAQKEANRAAVERANAKGSKLPEAVEALRTFKCLVPGCEKDCHIRKPGESWEGRTGCFKIHVFCKDVINPYNKERKPKNLCPSIRPSDGEGEGDDGEGKKKPKAVDPRRRWIPADKNKEKLRWPVVKVGFDLREKKWTKVEFVGDWVGDWAVEGKESEPVKFDESVFKTLSETPR